MQPPRRRPPTRSKLACATLFPSLSRDIFFCSECVTDLYRTITRVRTTRMWRAVVT